jgi:hypothetical protein
MNKISLRMPHHNVIANKYQTKNVTEKESKGIFSDKLLAIKEATEYIKKGEKVPFELLFHVNIQEIKKSLNSGELQQEYDRINSERFTNDYKIFGNVLLLSPKIQMESKVMKAKIEFIKMQDTTYKDELEYTYITPIKRVANKLFVEDHKVFDTLNQNMLNGKDVEFNLSKDDYFNPLTIQRNMDSVMFHDKVTNEDIYVKINPQNLPKMIGKFGALDTKEAKEYIKPLYEEAAFNIGYLEANKNMSGFLSKDEAKDLKNVAILDDNSEIKEFISLNDYFKDDKLKSDKFIYRFGFIPNINEFINKTIEQDKNLDHNINFKSIYTDKSLDVISSLKTSESIDIVDMNKYANNNFKRFFAFESNKSKQS